MKRTFRVAVFGASDAANKKLLKSLHRARGGELVDVPDPLARSAARFFDHEVTGDRKLHARFRVETVLGGELSSRAFLGLFGADGVVFVPGGEHAAAWRAAQGHFATYGDAVVMIASARPVDGATGVLVPPSGAALADAIEAEMIGAFHAGRVKGRATTTPSKAYTSRANALAAAAEIAIEVGRRGSRRSHESVRAMALHPALGFATTASLASLEATFFTYWNEARGKDVDAFWRHIARNRLPFIRRDVVAEVLAQGRITNREDYDTITDLISDERLTIKQRHRLDAMLGSYGRSRS